MTATEILSLIENVDPSDTAKLDELDARLFMFITHGSGKVTWPRDYNVQPWAGVKYTRSMDTAYGILKAGAALSLNVNHDGTAGYQYWPEKGCYPVESENDLPSACLAIIHAAMSERGSHE